ncbi:glycoside hydrolase family 15 protein [Brevundimonas sp.]|jgi:GH15 family glucan-1,4-alpha-glucosidase|uniref:glycoside hydrolase family 15 protein n=1 Tax=Brevundimonas sp. TaxID=1871086 RepID=UPI0037C06B15
MPDTTRRDGFLPLDAYTALGDGRAVALSGADGSLDWWCVPNMDSPPLFDRLLSPQDGGRFSITPVEPFTVECAYRPGSNVHETVFTTVSGRARLTESLNSGPAGRLPWEELARRLEGLEGRVEFRVEIMFGDRAGTISPFLADNANATVFHAGPVLGLIRLSDGVTIETKDDRRVAGRVVVCAGEREVLAIIAGADEPLVCPAIAEIDNRIDVSDAEWRTWSDRVAWAGPHPETLIRSALALKILLYSPSGAIVAAPTTSLPERIGGDKNWDYRYAWVRDAGYTIKAFLAIGAQAEAKAAFTWLVGRVAEHGCRVLFTLDGDVVEPVREIDVPGYRGSRPVRVGNDAAAQHQHGVYGDLFEVAWRFVDKGNILDDRTADVLSRLADDCADGWRRPDAGIWELPETRHYTMSKISCWQALDRAVRLADAGHIPTTCRDRWAREAQRVADWVEAECWSDALQTYVAWPGSTEIDASLALGVRFGYGPPARQRATLDAIDKALGAGPYHYRLTITRDEEGCFLACSFWMVEARVHLGQRARAEADFRALITSLDREGVYPEMIDPDTGEWLGNLPQGLTHLAIVHCIAALAEA